MRDKPVDALCAVCGAEADGLHYGALSCRSCNAFFRRAVTFDQKYLCRRQGNCDVSLRVRCACRACRFNKCVQAGMVVAAVQPRRDPTGSQKERRRPRRRRSYSLRSPLSSVTAESPVLVKEKMEAECHPNTSCDDPSTSSSTEATRINSVCTTTWSDDENDEFERLVTIYQEHQRMMQLAMTSVDDFLMQPEKGVQFRKMVATDVEKLSSVELSGLLYWIEKMCPYQRFTLADRTSLLKRYSVRKLSLDHFYFASKHPEMLKLGNFVMINNTFVPPGETGFDGVDDDEDQRTAARQIMRPTLERAFKCVLAPFAEMGVTDAEVVVLHMLLLWSVLNNSYVMQPTKEVMKRRREWAVNALMRHYERTGVPDPVVRLGQIVLLLGEIEVICSQHCSDYQLARLFNYCDMSKFWYDRLCYTET